MPDDAAEAIFTALKALHTADTGAGGLLNQTGDQFCPEFNDPDDIHEVASSPHIVCHTRVLGNDSTFGTAARIATATLVVHTEKGGDRAKQRAIVKRLHTVYGDEGGSVTPADTGGWQFRPLTIVSSPLGDRSDFRHAREVVLLVSLCETGGADYILDNESSPTVAGTIKPTADDIKRIRVRKSPRVVQSTPLFFDVIDRRIGDGDGQVEIDVAMDVNDANPPPDPSNSPFTITLPFGTPSVAGELKVVGVEIAPIQYGVPSGKLVWRLLCAGSLANA